MRSSRCVLQFNHLQEGADRIGVSIGVSLAPPRPTLGEARNRSPRAEAAPSVHRPEREQDCHHPLCESCGRRAGSPCTWHLISVHSQLCGRPGPSNGPRWRPVDSRMDSIGCREAGLVSVLVELERLSWRDSLERHHRENLKHSVEIGLDREVLADDGDGQPATGGRNCLTVKDPCPECRSRLGAPDCRFPGRASCQPFRDRLYRSDQTCACQSLSVKLTGMTAGAPCGRGCQQSADLCGTWCAL